MLPPAGFLRPSSLDGGEMMIDLSIGGIILGLIGIAKCALQIARYFIEISVKSLLSVSLEQSQNRLRSNNKIIAIFLPEGSISICDNSGHLIAREIF